MARLEDVRERTLSLIDTVPLEDRSRQHLPILSPMIWDLGHIASFERTWLARPREAGGRLDELFDPVRNPRSVRGGLDLPSGETLRRYLAEIRAESVVAIGAAEAPGTAYAVELVAQHEEQHQETLLQSMQLLTPPYEPGLRRDLPGGNGAANEMVEVPAGPFEMGAPGPVDSADPFAYDNERPRHRCEVEAFRIDRYPVSVREYSGFVASGGYREPRLWSAAGAEWLESSGVEAPANWLLTPAGHQVRHMGHTETVEECDRAVSHVCFWEAEAYANWVGKRLPTEAEWEKAALYDPATAESRWSPWGGGWEPALANLDQLGFGPSERGAYPGGRSPVGAEQMIGDVWEWTRSDFRAYPGFQAHPYREYSEVFFGDEYKVLRGGSWATRPDVGRGTFRNWDYPIRRQIFAGFRCVSSA